jgi:predicted MPP superfamily phosphohydrolase
VFLLFDDGVRLMKLLAHQLFRGPEGKYAWADVKISRSKFLNQLALIAGAIPFTAMVWGMAQGAYSYRVKRVALRVPHLPEAFDGYRLLQISDLHTGSFRSTRPLYKAVELINRQQADLVLFTGDLVNSIATEVLVHLPALRQIKARTAIFSVLGNHDYGDYVQWDNPESKVRNMQRLQEAHRQLGWNLLLNENRTIEKNGQRIAIIGVENWSNKRSFPKYGNLQKAYAGTEPIPFKILLSHDPSHWDAEVNAQFPDIDLTLSGHTHGMQFGINLPGLKWSPVQYVYDQWAGLYQKGQQYLYVNTGLGFLGYPGRVGFLPEITVFELRKG